MNQSIPLSSIHVREEDRLRFESGEEVEELKDSLTSVGQLQPVRVLPREDPEKPWELNAGYRRFRAIQELSQEDSAPRGLDPGEILAVTSSEDLSDVQKLIAEFDENEHREGFSWKEKAYYVGRIHEMGKEANEAWTLEMTATLVRMSISSVSRYLDIVKDPEVFESDKVQESATFNTAFKQAKIQKARLTRKRMIEKGLDVPKPGIDYDPKKDQEDEKDWTEMVPQAQEVLYNGDCREWLANLPDESVHLVHWDPPYGGSQGGGAFALHKKINDTQEYAQELMESCFPEIFRVLKDGCWLILWYHPSYYQWIIDTLHSQEPDGWWINPYPNTWHKTNRHSDGHEILRYLTNVQEHFLLIGKQVEEDLIIHQPHFRNIFPFDLPSSDARRHVMHKPAKLLDRLIALTTIPGEIVIDPSFGSGSIIEACRTETRKFSGCEIEEEYYEIGVEVMAKEALVWERLPINLHSAKGGEDG